MAKTNDLDGTLRREWVKCGKPECKRCAGKGHGPYWYSYYRVEGKLRKTYIGAWLPEEYEHLLTDSHEPLCYSRHDHYYHKECIAALGYYGPDIVELLRNGGIEKVHATAKNRHLVRSSYCSQCGKDMKALSR